MRIVSFRRRNPSRRAWAVEQPGASGQAEVGQKGDGTALLRAKGAQYGDHNRPLPPWKEALAVIPPMDSKLVGFGAPEALTGLGGQKTHGISQIAIDTFWGLAYSLRCLCLSHAFGLREFFTGLTHFLQGPEGKRHRGKNENIGPGRRHLSRLSTAAGTCTVVHRSGFLL